MKKIGILTFYLNHNYGSTLQCYALKKAVESIADSDVHIIPHTFIKKIENGFGEPYLYEQYENRIRMFDDFLKNDIGCREDNILNLTPDNAPNDDIYIVGSDVLWDTSLTGGDPNYFLDFAKDMQVRKIAYGVGLNVTDTSVLRRELFEEYIDRFDYLSLRECMYIDFIQQFTAKKIYHVLDPTFLLPQSHYVELMNRKEKKKGFILLYLIYVDSAQIQKMIDYANRVALARDLEIIHFIYNIPEYVFGDRGRTFAFEGPKDFLWYVAHADLIITTSFHGVAFSIIFRKPFYVIRRRNGEIKTIELLRSLGFENRIMNYNMDIENLDFQLDYSQTESVLKEKVEMSYAYLRKAIDLEEASEKQEGRE